MLRLLFFSLSTICGYNSRVATKRGRRLFLSLEQAVKLCTTTITRLKSNRELPVLSTCPLLAVRLFLYNAPINDLPHPPPCGQHTGFRGVLPEIIAQTKGNLPFPNVLVEYLEDTYEVSFLSEESISD